MLAGKGAGLTDFVKRIKYIIVAVYSLYRFSERAGVRPTKVL